MSVKWRSEFRRKMNEEESQRRYLLMQLEKLQTLLDEFCCQTKSFGQSKRTIVVDMSVAIRLWKHFLVETTYPPALASSYIPDELHCTTLLTLSNWRTLAGPFVDLRPVSTVIDTIIGFQKDLIKKWKENKEITEEIKEQAGARSSPLP